MVAKFIQLRRKMMHDDNLRESSSREKTTVKIITDRIGTDKSYVLMIIELS